MKNSKVRGEIEQSVLMARREYQRRWRKNNPEKVKAIQQRFYQKQAQKLAAANEQANKKPSE